MQTTRPRLSTSISDPGPVSNNSPMVVDSPIEVNLPSTESEPLLPVSSSPIKKPWFRARPLWLLPFALLVAVSRGMTLAPRVQVFTQLACDLTAFPVQNTSITFPNLSLANVSTSNPENDYLSGRIPYERCLKDPRVQSRASKLQTTLLTTMGILSAITTGWWGRYSENHGRLTVLSYASVGMLVTDAIFYILAIDSLDSPKHRQLLLAVAPILDGLLGGYSTIQSSVSSYISDCTSDGSRANIFSRFHGAFFIGIAIGPEIGALLIKLTGGVSAVFLTSTSMLIVNFFLVCFVLPESLGKRRPTRQEISISDDDSAEVTRTRRFFAYPISLVAPLRVFLPKTRTDSKRWDWSFTALAGAFFCSYLVMGMYSTKYLYADHVYSWDAEKLSYFITGTGTFRALHLLMILPYVLRSLKTPITPAVRASPYYPQILAKEMYFDLLIAKCSLLLDILANLFIIAVHPSQEALFIIASFMTSFGSGVNPSLQSLALSLSQSYEENIGIGEIMGAISFLMAVGSMILGPIIFGLTFSATVAFAPKTIYLIATLLSASAFLFLGFVKPYRRLKAILWEREQATRGRSRASKDLSVPRTRSL